MISCWRFTCLILMGVFIVSGCAPTPTGPTPSASTEATASGSRSVAGIAPDLSIAPPRALGVTRFVAFGDSITWGATSSFYEGVLFLQATNGGYAERLQTNLTTAHTPQQFTVFNEGVPGERAMGAVTRFRSVLTMRRPQVVLLLEGINDISNNDVPISLVINALRDMLDAAAAAGVPVLLATMYQTYEEESPDGTLRLNGAASVPTFNREVRRLATGRLNVYLVDLEPLITDRKLVGKDGIHLEDAGFDVMANAFKMVIETAFPVRGSFQ